MITPSSAIATADPARINRVGPVVPPADNASTSTAAANPPRKATPPAGNAGSEIPKAANTTTARYAPAFTPSVSGEASGFRASDCRPAPANPNARPTSTPASSRGNRDATRTLTELSVPRPITSFRRSPALTDDVPWVRWMAASTTTDGQRDQEDPGHADPAYRLEGGDELGPAGGELGQDVTAWTAASMNCSVDFGPPNIQMPSGSRCTLFDFTNGRFFQIAFLARSSPNTSPPSVLLAM